MSPQLRSVEEAALKALQKSREPHHYTVADFFEPVQNVCKLFSELIGSHDAARSTVIPSASYGLANVARNLPAVAGKNVVMADETFPSNVYTWMRWAEDHGGEVRIVRNPLAKHPDPQLEIGDHSWNQDILEAIDENTVAVALPHVHWADGKVFNLESIRQKSREVGAWLVIDGTQSIGALPFDVKTIEPDAVICAGYKWLLGPYSIGLAWYGEVLDEGIPIEQNWINREHSNDFKNLINYQPHYRPKAARYGVGEQSNFLLLPMMAAALDQVHIWTPEAINNYCAEITDGIFEQLYELGYSIGHGEEMSPHLFGVRLPAGMAVEKVQEELAHEKVFVSLRGSAVRVSPHVYNSREDLEVLVECFRRAAAK